MAKRHQLCGCVGRSAVLLEPNVANILLFNFCEQNFVQHCPITIAIDCNGLSLLIFEEKWPNYASGPKSALNSDSFWVRRLFIACSIFFSAYNLFVSNSTCSLDLYSGDVQTKTVLFTHKVSSHKTDWITTTCHLLCLDLLYTYIIGHYNPSVRIIHLVSHSTYVVCVNFIHKWRDLQFKVNSERQNFWETFDGNFIFARNLLRGNRRRNTFCISFWCLAWYSNPGFSSN